MRIPISIKIGPKIPMISVEGQGKNFNVYENRSPMFQRMTYI